MIGVDIEKVSRLESAAKSEPFLYGAFTEIELKYYQAKGRSAETLTGMFCAKEALAKALGSGFVGFRPRDVEILHDASGAPFYRLYGKAEELLNGRKVELSIAHTEEFAVAFAVIQD